MSVLSARKVKQIVKAVGGLEQFAKQCHVGSLEVIRTGLLPKGARIARGFCEGVGVHSWIVLGNPYDENVQVLDPTLWSWIGEPPSIWQGLASDRPHTPKGAGSIWAYGRPADPTGPIIELDAKLSLRAREFLKLAAPKGLDRDGWFMLANAPVEGWPAAEIMSAMADHPRLAVYVPIDVIGMLTDRNPRNLYW